MTPLMVLGGRFRPGVTLLELRLMTRAGVGEELVRRHNAVRPVRRIGPVVSGLVMACVLTARARNSEQMSRRTS